MDQVRQVRQGRTGRLILKGLLILLGVAAGLGCLFVGVFLYLTYNPVPRTYGIALGDLDGDGDLDAFYANGQNEGPRPNTVLMNQGGGRLKDSGQRLGREESRRVTLGDLDGDGRLDAWVANIGYNTLFFNDGQGRFTEGTSRFEDISIGSAMWSVALGDLNGDGTLDALGGGCCGAVSNTDEKPENRKVHPPYSMVWLNPDRGQDVRRNIGSMGQPLESLGAMGTALGDLDGDGDLDVFFANDSLMDHYADVLLPQPNTVWWNDGQGRFSDSGQRLEAARSTWVALGDLDGDGDLDAFVTNHDFSEVWLNAGGKQAGRAGTFLDSGQRLGDRYYTDVTLADLDGDGDLDAALISLDSFSGDKNIQIWFNDGQARFSESSQRISSFRAQAFALGDLNGDGRVDVLAGWYAARYAIWWNRGDGTFAR